jgi:pimeloyl-ACP methyl ester carboxylesterase
MTRTRAAAFLAAILSLLLASPAVAGGEAGPIKLRDQGYFWVGVRKEQVATTGPGGVAATGTTIAGHMYVGFQLPAKKRHPYPLVLVHGGGAQSTGWMGTPDGRDGLLDYFLAAGFDVYFIDRPGFGRSPYVPSYGPPGQPWTTETIAGLFTARSPQYPGGGQADSPEVALEAASTEVGPSASNTVLKEDLGELLDRIGPVIIITHSAGGPSGWLALDARPDLVKGVLAIEPVMGVTDVLAPLIGFAPELKAGETIATEARAAEGAGLDPCRLQPDGSVRTAPAFAHKKIRVVVSPNSIFTANTHCSVRALNQLGADAELARLVDFGIEGNGHMMNEELNNGEIARKVLIPWLASVK